MPTGVSGVRTDRLNQAENHRKGHRGSRRAPTGWARPRRPATPNAAGPETVVPGGNLAASLSYGDITQGGVGTVTATCNGKVVGFGHPMTFLGKTTLTLHPADALFIQPESLGAPFKLANLGAPAGTISDDHLTGITGFLGATPETSASPRRSPSTAARRTGASQVSVPQALASTVFYEHVANHDRVVDGAIPGAELQSWTISGTQGAADTPFSLQVTDRYASNWDITYESAWELADFVWSLSAVPGVTIDDVTMSSDVIDDSSTWEITEARAARGQHLGQGRQGCPGARQGRQGRAAARGAHQRLRHQDRPGLGHGPEQRLRVRGPPRGGRRLQHVVAQRLPEVLRPGAEVRRHPGPQRPDRGRAQPVLAASRRSTRRRPATRRTRSSTATSRSRCSSSNASTHP